MDEERLSIIVDKRERNQDIINALEENEVDLTFKVLPAGDYLISNSNRICIERKTVHDFEKSIIDGRLFEQLERIKRTYELPVVVVEGSRSLFRLPNNAILGAIISVTIDNGVRILFSEDSEETAKILCYIARHESRKEHSELSLKRGVKAVTRSQFQEMIIANLPGIGPKLSRSLLTHFKTIKRIANASVEQLMEVEKIGKKKAGRIHETINALYKSESAAET